MNESCRFVTDDGVQCARDAADPSNEILLCSTHLAPIVRFVRARLAIRSVEGDRPETPEQVATRRAWDEAMDGQAVVYYVRIGSQCKIGTTRNMIARMRAIVPDEVLATEPGGQQLEHMRHRQFAHLHEKGERFAYRDELVDHVAMLLRYHGAPTITGPLPR